MGAAPGMKNLNLELEISFPGSYTFLFHCSSSQLFFSNIFSLKLKQDFLSVIGAEGGLE